MSRAVFLSLLMTTSALAQVAPEREVEVAKALYDAGKYTECIARVREAMAVANFSDVQRIELHRVSGLSAFNLGDQRAAKESFLALLRLNPDYVLDPFVAPPPAIRLFDQVKKDSADELSLVRQLLQVRAEQERRAEEERKKLEQQRAERRVVTIDRRPLWMNFLPFGAGQLLQDRTGWGVTFAVTEGVLAVASIVAYLAIESLKVTIVETLNDRLTPTGTFTRQLRGIPPSAQAERDRWNGVKWVSGGGFYLIYALGVIDALMHHTGDRVREGPAEPRLSISPIPGGVTAGLQLSF